MKFVLQAGVFVMLTHTLLNLAANGAVQPGQSLPWLRVSGDPPCGPETAVRQVCGGAPVPPQCKVACEEGPTLTGMHACGVKPKK